MRTLKDAIYALAVGDAVGVPFEFKARGTFHATDMTGWGTHHKPPGTWSDDTSMTLATCASLRELGRVDTDDMRRRFREWEEGKYTADGDCFDEGGTTAKALALGHGLDGEWDNGNGSLMRILPLAFTDATDEEIEAVSAITHAHKTSRACCVTWVHIARDLIEGKTLPEALAALAGTRFEYLAHIGERPEKEIKSTGYVVDTLEAALWSLLNTSSLREAILTAVNLGDDTDTVAAVAGGLAGILYGYESIPAEWVERLRGKEIIDACLGKREEGRGKREEVR